MMAAVAVDRATDTVRLERSGGVARIILARPEAGNAIDLSMAEAIVRAVDACADDEAVRCVVLTGKGRMFCVGGDVASFAAAGDEAPAFLEALADTMHRATKRLVCMRKPLLVLVNGPAAGVGLSLALLGDVVLSARSAHFTAAYTAIGLTPDGGMSWLLPRLIGLRRAQAMILTNQRVSADEAVAIGLITRAVDDVDLPSQGQEVAAALEAAPVAALGAARALLMLGTTTTLEAQLDEERKAVAAAGATNEGREGVAAFVARRKPNFRLTQKY